MQSVDSIKEKLKARLTPRHFEHSLGTARTAADMAHAYGLDEEKAYLAGLLHDYAKSMSGAELLAAAAGFGIEAIPVEIEVPYLLHSQLGACMVKEELGIVDREILDGIKHHTIGACSMTDFDKIIYIADMIEPGRAFEGLDRLRHMALEGLDEVFREAYAHSLSHLVKARKLIHPVTVEVWNRLVAQEHGRLL